MKLLKCEVCGKIVEVVKDTQVPLMCCGKPMKELVAKINEQIALFQENAALQVEKNNKAAGTRARKAALELSKLMKEFRKESVEAAK